MSCVPSVDPESTTTTCRGGKAAGLKIAVSVSPMKRASFLARITIETLCSRELGMLKVLLPAGGWILRATCAPRVAFLTCMLSHVGMTRQRGPRFPVRQLVEYNESARTPARGRLSVHGGRSSVG